MRLSRIVVLLLAVLAIALLLDSCNSLALTGARKYKTDLTNALLNVQTDIETNGEVSQRNIDKLASTLSKYEAEYSKKNSFTTSKKILETVQTIATEKPGNAFQQYRGVLGDIAGVNELLKTEVE